MQHSIPLCKLEPAAYDCIAGSPDADVLLVCDHASPVIPACYNELGLAGADRLAHVAWDIGGAAVTHGLARRLGCPAVLAGVSRLVIDCNRRLGDPSSIPAISCGVPVPGNAEVNAAEAYRRAEQWFWPYHRRVGTTLAQMRAGGRVPAVVSIHSFTPCMGTAARPWHVGVLSNRDLRMATPALAALGARSDLVVGDNQPYSAREINYTLDSHCGTAGLPHVSFEIRQDLVADLAGCERWADLLAQVLASVLADPALRRVQAF